MSQKDKNKKCVVICGGPGTRLNPITMDMPKSLIPVKGKPILYYIVDFWRAYTNDFVFILNYKKEDIMKFVRTLPIRAEFIEETGEPKGIASALTYAKKMAGEDFILVLGDCICKGEFVFPADMRQGVGVWQTDNPDDIKQSYSVEIKDNKIIRVVEKPSVLSNNLCGLGFYFFNQKIFDAICRTRPSLIKKRVELTDSIQTMIENGEEIYPVFLKGEYLNLTYPEDIKKADVIL